MDFKDCFSGAAKEYSKYRPKYPPELFEYLSSITPGHDLALDCATGNGQAAMGLTPYFKKIIATDASASQIEHAAPNPKIEYKVALAENSGLEDKTADLVTVATAIHWLDQDKFYAEARRVLKPGGIIAVWIYSGNEMEPEVDRVFKEHFYDRVESYWPAEAKNTRTFEKSVKFPFTEIIPPKFKIVVEWNLKQYLNYLYTWSSTQNYIKQSGKNPLEEKFEMLKKVWGDENSKKEVTWDLKMKVGKV